MTTVVPTRQETRLAPMVIVALTIVYIVWGSTYLAIELTLATLPPIIMTGMRFLAAGLILMTFLLTRGYHLPTAKQWRNCAIVGGLMLGGCVGGIAIAQQSISSGLAAVGIATVPMWTALLGGAFERKWPNSFEITGIAFGFAGVILLNVHGGIAGESKGAVIIVVAAICWSIGSVLSQHLDLPEGPVAYGGEMLAGGVITAAAGLVVFGEHVSNTAPDADAVWSWIYLVVAGSLLAYTAYMYLLRTVRIALATSYTLVTPIVAVLLGAVVLSEKIDVFTLLAVIAVMVGVGFIFRGRVVKVASS